MYIEGDWRLNNHYGAQEHDNCHWLSNVPDGGYDDLIIAECLPGQRDGARSWYFFFCDFLEKQLGMECCKEQRSILKVKNANGGGCMLLHVDDVLFAMSSNFTHQTFLAVLKQSFKLSVTWVDRKKSGSFEFLKRLHVLDAGFERLDIYGETKHVKQGAEMFKRANGGKAGKLHNTPAASHVFAGRDDSELLDESMSGAYRSLVGCILYLSHDRSDVQHTVKCLASYLSSPTKHAWTQLGRLIGYLQHTAGYGVQMQCTQPGMSLFEKLADADQQNSSCSCLVESFSDSDWQEGKDLRSTSSAFHYLNGIRTDQESLAHWPTVEAWWISRLGMHGPAGELCELIYIPLVQQLGLNMCIRRGQALLCLRPWFSYFQVFILCCWTVIVCLSHCLKSLIFGKNNRFFELD